MSSYLILVTASQYPASALILLQSIVSSVIRVSQMPSSPTQNPLLAFPSHSEWNQGPFTGYNILSDLPTIPLQTHLYLPPLTHFIPATLTPLIFLRHAGTSYPRASAFAVPSDENVLSPDTHMPLSLLCFKSLPSGHIFRETYSDHSLYNQGGTFTPLCTFHLPCFILSSSHLLLSSILYFSLIFYDLSITPLEYIRSIDQRLFSLFFVPPPGTVSGA